MDASVHCRLQIDVKSTPVKHSLVFKFADFGVQRVLRGAFDTLLNSLSLLPRELFAVLIFLPPVRVRRNRDAFCTQDLVRVKTGLSRQPGRQVHHSTSLLQRSRPSRFQVRQGQSWSFKLLVPSRQFGAGTHLFAGPDHTLYVGRHSFENQSCSLVSC